MTLSDRDRAILDFEAAQKNRRHTGVKDEAARAELGLAPARYYQLLGRLMDDADAIAYAPQLCATLRRLRDERQAARAARTHRP